jgi:hypothetical protein
MILPHINLGQIGVVGDQNGQALPVNAWTDSYNVRFTNLGIEKIAESTLRIPVSYDFKIFTTKLRNGVVHIFAASKGGLHMYDGTDWYFTPAEVSPDAVWHFTHWGDTVIFNCVEHPPFMFDWDTVDAPENVSKNSYFVPLPKWGIISTEWDLTTGGDPSFDTEARCERLVAYKSQLVAVGLMMREPIDAEIDPDDVPDQSPVYEKTEMKQKSNVCWVSDTTSDPTYKVPEGESGGGADAGISGAVRGGPPSWDYISPATLSVQQVVGAADGRYIAAEPLNDSIIIYTPTAAHALVFTGGQYVVQTRRLFERGAAGPYCVCEFSNNHFVVDGDQLYIHDGSTATRVGEDMFDVEFFKRAVNLKNTTLCHDQENREIWIYFDSIHGRKGCVFSYSTSTFGWVDGEADNKPITYARRGYLPQTGAQWADMTGPWKDYFPTETINFEIDEQPQTDSGVEIRKGTVELAGNKIKLKGRAQHDVAIQIKELGSIGDMKYLANAEGYLEATIRINSKTTGMIANSANDDPFPDKLGDIYVYRSDTGRLPRPLDVTSTRFDGVIPIPVPIPAHSYTYYDNMGSDSEGREYRKVKIPVTLNSIVVIEASYLALLSKLACPIDIDVTLDKLVLSGVRYEDASEDPRWRWIDQYTYTNRYKILALTPNGICQKEAFHSKERESWVERKAIDLDDAGINGWVIKHLKQYHMQLAGEGKVGVRTGWAESALANPVWEKPTWLDETGPGSYQADMRTSGRYLSLRFEFKEMGQFRWANGYMDIEVSGRR